MYGRKKIEYYIKNGPEKVKPFTKEEMARYILHSEDPIQDILESPFSLGDEFLIEKIKTFSKNLIKYYPWKLYVEIAKARGLNLKEEIERMPEYGFIKYVDENEFTPD